MAQIFHPPGTVVHGRPRAALLRSTAAATPPPFDHTHGTRPQARASRTRNDLPGNGGSTAGRVATPLLGASSASKFAVQAISDALRQELAPWGVPVILIEPGSFKSRNRASTEAAARADRASMSEDAERRYGRAMDAFIVFSKAVEARAGDPEQVAAVVERAYRQPPPAPVPGRDWRARDRGAEPAPAGPRDGRAAVQELRPAPAGARLMTIPAAASDPVAAGLKRETGHRTDRSGAVGFRIAE